MKIVHHSDTYPFREITHRNNKIKTERSAICLNREGKINYFSSKDNDASKGRPNQQRESKRIAFSHAF